MSSLKAIRTRIRSVKSTQQITRAMKMIAVARLRRAQDAVQAARPYAERLRRVLDEPTLRSSISLHPLVKARPQHRSHIILVTGDRGLCGGFNANAIRRYLRFKLENEAKLEEIQLSTIGRKGYDYFNRRGEVRAHHAGLFSNLTFGAVKELSRGWTERFLADEFDALYLVYNELVGVASQRVTLMRLLPFELSPGDPDAPEDAAFEPLFEPGRAALLDALLPRAVAAQAWRALLESMAGEQAARMAAMESATNNAADLIAALTLQYNRTRQAAITKELVEVVSGAEALA